MCSFSDLSFSSSRVAVSRMCPYGVQVHWFRLLAGRETRGSNVNTESFYCLRKACHHILYKKCISTGCPPYKLKLQCCFQKDKKKNTCKTDKPKTEGEGVSFLLQFRQTSAGEPSTAAWRMQGQQPEASAWRVTQDQYNVTKALKPVETILR